MHVVSDKRTLLLRFAGPMQSWGVTTRVGDTVRDTSLEPTLSGVVGMIASAQGRSRFDDVSDLACLEMRVRIDRKGSVMRDYQTARQGSTAYQSSRYCIADAEFVVALTGDTPTVEGAARALADPVHPIYLGRRAFLPTMPVVIGVTDGDPDDAVRSASVRELRSGRYVQPRPGAEFRIIRPAHQGDVSTMRRHDVPVSFAPARSYGFRDVVEETWIVPGGPVEHDPVAFLGEIAAD